VPAALRAGQGADAGVGDLAQGLAFSPDGSGALAARDPGGRPTEHEGLGVR